MNNAFLLFVLRIVHATRFGLKRREKAFHRSKARAFSRSLVIKSRSILGKIAMKDPGMDEGRESSGTTDLPTSSVRCFGDWLIPFSFRGSGPVSYTHLTLPTTDVV